MDAAVFKAERLARKGRSAKRSFVTTRKILIAMFVFVFIFSLSYLAYAGEDFWDSLYWTACSLTWAYCGDADILYTPEVKAISILNGITTIAILLVLLYSTTEHILDIDLNVIKMRKKISGMKNHFIICGYGRVGEKVSEVLERNNISFVVIEKKKDVIDNLKESGVPAIEGDSMNPRILERAGIGRARGLISTLGSDSDNVFLALTAKELNPQVMVAARAHSENVVAKLHKAGATIVVLPEIVGGLELGREILQLGETHKDRLISRSNHKKGDMVF